ncbi:hypothetical protein M432DRAFT_471816 [Thermoascus aurantiacus ATCC 26904]
MGRYGDRASRSVLACWYLGHHPKSQAAQVPHARPRPPSSLLVPSQPYQPVARRDTQHLLCIDLFYRTQLFLSSVVSPIALPFSFSVSVVASASCPPSYHRLSPSSPFLRHPLPRKHQAVPVWRDKDLPSLQTAAAPQACALPCVMLLLPCVTVG